ncbi:MAG: hypothetical protein Greene101449_1206 [Candidatus Peregrinibacteria bacterium Greene1014_49]|nr:MAG: hypothetical protein Greene101449_1206 [Candidatus Peregrinibacteria bacterium Greene1014_49]
MTPLQWQESPEQVPPQKRPTASADSHDSAVGKADPWFVIAMALIGLVVGFLLAKSL